MRFPLRYSAHRLCKGIQEFESCLTSLGRVSRAYPNHVRFNEAGGLGGKEEAHGLARLEGGFGLQSQAMRGEVNGRSEVFSLVTLNRKSHRYLDPFTLRPAFHRPCGVRHATRLHVGGPIINGPRWGLMTRASN